MLDIMEKEPEPKKFLGIEKKTWLKAAGWGVVAIGFLGLLSLL